MKITNEESTSEILNTMNDDKDTNSSKQFFPQWNIVSARKTKESILYQPQTLIQHRDHSSAAVSDKTVNRSAVLERTVNASTVLGGTVNASTVLDETVNTTTVSGESVNTSDVPGKTVNTTTVLNGTVNTSAVLDETVNTSAVLGKTVNTTIVLGEGVNKSAVLGENSKSIGNMLNTANPKTKSIETVAVVSMSQTEAYKSCSVNPYLKWRRNSLQPHTTNESSEKSKQTDEKIEDSQTSNRNNVKVNSRKQNQHNFDKRRSKSCIIL